MDKWIPEGSGNVDNVDCAMILVIALASMIVPALVVAALIFMGNGVK